MPSNGLTFSSCETSMIRSSSRGLSKTKIVLKPILSDKIAKLINSLSLIPLHMMVDSLERSCAKAINNSGSEIKEII